MRGLEEQLDGFDLTLGRLCLLVSLRRCGRAMLPSELSDDLAVTRANISNLLNSLERDNMVSREFDPSNRRRVLVHLTDRGQEVLSQAWPVYEQTISGGINAKLSDEEQQQLKALLNKLS